MYMIARSKAISPSLLACLQVLQQIGWPVTGIDLHALHDAIVDGLVPIAGFTDRAQVLSKKLVKAGQRVTDAASGQGIEEAQIPLVEFQAYVRGAGFRCHPAEGEVFQAIAAQFAFGVRQAVGVQPATYVRVRTGEPSLLDDLPRFERLVWVP